MSFSQKSIKKFNLLKIELSYRKLDLSQIKIGDLKLKYSLESCLLNNSFFTLKEIFFRNDLESWIKSSQLWFGEIVRKLYKYFSYIDFSTKGICNLIFDKLSTFSSDRLNRKISFGDATRIKNIFETFNIHTYGDLRNNGINFLINLNGCGITTFKKFYYSFLCNNFSHLITPNYNSQFEELSNLNNRLIAKICRIAKETNIEITFKEYEDIHKKICLCIEEYMLSRFDRKAFDIVKRRYLKGQKETLKNIGDSYRISRERIRQIERKTINDIVSDFTLLDSYKTDYKNIKLFVSIFDDMDDSDFLLYLHYCCREKFLEWNIFSKLLQMSGFEKSVNDIEANSHKMLSNTNSSIRASENPKISSDEKLAKAIEWLKKQNSNFLMNKISFSSKKHIKIQRRIIFILRKNNIIIWLELINAYDKNLKNLTGIGNYRYKCIADLIFDTYILS